MQLSLALFFFLSINLSAVSQELPLKIHTSVEPVKTLIKKIGGEQVDVQVLIKSGFNPHHYNPTVKQISALSHSSLYIDTGLEFEKSWLPRFRAANPEIEILSLNHTVFSAEDGHQTDQNSPHSEHQHKYKHQHKDDPHIWTSPLKAKKFAIMILDRLIMLKPDSQSLFKRNYHQLILELEQLDREIFKLLKPLNNRKFMVFHPAWDYFAETYNLKQISVEHEGKEPGAKALSKIIDLAKKEKISVIFVQPQFSTKQAEIIADAINGEVITIDPLDADYFATLRKLSYSIAGLSIK